MVKLILFFCLSLLHYNLADSSESRVMPAALQKGDLIAIVFPASYLDCEEGAEERILKSSASWLQSLGYRTIFYPETIQRKGYFAGTDAERAEALMQAWKNEDVKAIWCFRGGYGSQCILSLLDFEFIKSNPKIFIGMSDITALHHAIQIKTGLVTFLGPLISYFNNQKSTFDDNYAFSAFEKVLIAGDAGKIELPERWKIEVLRPGKAQGRLVGGNLKIVAGFCGTEWQLNTEGKVLILEDVSSDISRIDRMLWQLRESGLLNNPAAVILASWDRCNPTVFKYSHTLDQVFDYYFSHAHYPVIRNFPSGHIKYQTNLPLNTLVEIDTDAKAITLLESSVTMD